MGRGPSDVVRGAWRNSLDLTAVLVKLENEFSMYRNRRGDFNQIVCVAVGALTCQILFKWYARHRALLGARDAIHLC